MKGSGNRTVWGIGLILAGLVSIYMYDTGRWKLLLHAFNAPPGSPIDSNIGGVPIAGAGAGISPSSYSPPVGVNMYPNINPPGYQVPVSGIPMSNPSTDWLSSVSSIIQGIFGTPAKPIQSTPGIAGGSIGSIFGTGGTKSPSLPTYQTDTPILT